MKKGHIIIIKDALPVFLALFTAISKNISSKHCYFTRGTESEFFEIIHFSEYSENHQGCDLTKWIASLWSTGQSPLNLLDV